MGHLPLIISERFSKKAQMWSLSSAKKGRLAKVRKLHHQSVTVNWCILAYYFFNPVFVRLPVSIHEKKKIGFGILCFSCLYVFVCIISVFITFCMQIVNYILNSLYLYVFCKK